jgi:hypothetical protein
MTDQDATALHPTPIIPPSPPTGPPTVGPPPLGPPPPPDLRPTLRRLGTGLVIYGTIGVLLALVGLLLMLYVGGRIGELADRTSAQVDTIIATLDDTSAALIDAGATAGSFAGTLERTPPTIRGVADTIGDIQSQLEAVSSQLALFSILGANPLSGVGALFGGIAGGLSGLDSELTQVATDLADNRDRLVANATSLETLGLRLDQIADQLRTGVVQDSLADVQVVTTLLVFTLVIWTAVPAVGALLLGWWLRRELAPPS